MEKPLPSLVVSPVVPLPYLPPPLMTKKPLTTAELEEKLDESLDPGLSARRTTPLAEALAPLTRVEQDCVLHWTDVIAKTNTAMAFLFAAQAPEGIRSMDLATIEAWVVRAMDVYDRMGLFPACAVFRDVAQFVAEAHDQANGVSFENISSVLGLFVRGLAGRALKLESADETYTDTNTLFLPAQLARLPDPDSNFRLYKAMAAHQWAQARYGSFPDNLGAILRRYPDPDRALRVFHALETVRLDARLERELTGLHREMSALRAALNESLWPPAWETKIAPLRRPQASVEDSAALLAELYDGELPAPVCYQGAMHPERVEAAIAARIEREKNEFRTALVQMLGEKDGKYAESEKADLLGGRFSVSRNEDRPGEFSFTLNLDGKPIAPPDDVRALMDSIIQDLGQIPDDYLTAAGDGGYQRHNDEKRPEDVWKGVYHEEGAFLYNEWDYRRSHYRKHWAVLREIDVRPVDEPFVARTRHKYAGLIHSLRRTFEALRGEEKLLKKQVNGDNVDFDALVEAWADMHTGREMTDQLFTKLHKHERNIAVMFMVDMSGSTKGWINEAERESLVLLCEAIEVLGDRYAIYGFSGMTRKRCELYRIKRFDEPYSELVQKRIAGIQPKDYTRMGVTIRHLTKLLKDIDARTKLLITLSDGKPDDYDGYRGDYGIEDTRQALIEAKRDGIHPFCITIDSEARDYLPHMYGAVNWTLVEEVKKLPLKVSDIYRRLTT
jgi:nitric oxide reductase NorD protein